MVKKIIFSFLLVLGLTQFAIAQKQNVSGVITEAETGMPLPGVNVMEKGTSNGTSTDFDGNFSIKVDNGATLVFSMVGYATQEVAVTSGEVNIKMETDTEALDEVVVTALGIKRKEKALGYAVSEISSEQLTESGNTNFASAMYGKASGVKITTAPGGASSAVNVQIRGVNSLNYDQQPLYVVDGVVIRNDQQNGASGANNNNYWGDQRIRGNGILDINPNDIETLSILKGASATALYGSDASSGVVVITTKKGTKSKGLGVDVNFTGTVEEVAFLPKFQNVYGPGYDRETNLAVGANEEGWIEEPDSPTGLRPNFRAYGNFGPKMEGQDVLWWDGKVRSYSARKNNYKDVYRTGYSSNVNVAVSENTEKLNYRFTASRLDYEGTQEGSDQEKNTLGLNSSIKLNDDIRLDVTANYINTLTHNRPYQLGQVLGSFGGYFSRTEDMSLMKDKFKTSDGYKYVTYNYPERSDEAFLYNIRATNLLDFFWQQMRNSYDETENRLISSATLNWDVTDNLTFRGRVGSDYTSLNAENKQYNEYPVQFNSSSSSTGSFSASSGKYSIVYTDLLLSYADKITDDFEFSVSGGFQSRSEDYKDQQSNTTNGLVTENWFSLNNSYGILSTSYNRKELLKYAFLGLANISYKDFLFLEGTARQEYASTLPVKNNSYFYPSVNGSFVFDDVLNVPDFMNYGKIRASYGVVGNAPPMYESNISYSQTSLQTINGSVPALTLSAAYGNENLKPEKKYEAEFGLELQFLKNRLGLDVSYYNNKVKNQILGLQTAASVGATSQIVNIGEIGSEGFELALNATPIFTGTDGFKWDTRFNFSVNKTKVNSLMPGVDELVFYTAEQNTIKIVAGVGERLGNIYVNPIAKDDEGNNLINDDGLYVMDKDSYVKAGNIMPKAVGGWSNTFSYKNFSLNLNVDYRIGGQMVSPNTKYMMGAGMLENTMKYRDAAHGGLSYTENGKTYNDGVLLDGVNQNTGEPNSQVIDAATYYMNTFNWGNDSWSREGAIYDNSYIKMREASLTYRFPSEIAEKIKLNRLSLSLVGRNLFYFWRTLENIDPEAPLGNKWWSQGVDVGSTAASRSFGFSLNASF
ncbi:SusC/RagA family TonB-linked outer membrane protein [Zunongwangia pacifica]|uniref:SusC/RagA family TonB-linked outer membrane protein n=1 Tax=Zunongwangia pacifica TaxID=2911062 RepID=A0A9X1ZUH6_9FLAO|nr:SusC/RagA family TonB-linked outer membrane protein [Zunongwangia pacifica]MCL6218683.1 SusC/RagA family TonB-linked outer membrane protein [Zunongwangia pacifica]